MMKKKNENIFTLEFNKLLNKKINIGSFKLSLQISKLAENTLIDFFRKSKPQGTIIATGSFARRELSFYSDLHIIWLIPQNNSAGNLIEKLTEYFAELGFNIVTLILKLDELEKIKNDISLFTKLFEARYLFGSKKLFNEFVNKLLTLVDKENKKDLIARYELDIQKRYKYYGASPKILEPNIKYTAGGLRDLQSVEWMYSIKNNLILTNEPEKTRTQTFIEILKKEKDITTKEATKILQAYAFQLSLRNLLHKFSGRKNDRLDFESQRKAAKELNYKAEEWKQLMKKYFEAANLLHGFSKTMIKKFKEEITPPLSDHLLIPLDDKFSLKGNKISANNGRHLTISAILRAFYYRGFHNAKFDKNLRSLISKSVQHLENKEFRKYEAAIFFREILKLPQNVGKTLHTMNELNVLGLLLTEFKEIVGFFTTDVSNRYTFDEHSLLAIENLEALSTEENEMGRLFNLTERKDLLYLALLLHEIGKPISIEGHEIIGSEFAFSICTRLGYNPTDTELVSFLIKNYLIMEQVALEENINDEQVIKKFSEIFPSLKHLNLLYLLSYANLSAFSPLVLTDWKLGLMQTLFNKTRKTLEDKFLKESSLYPISLEDEKEKKADLIFENDFLSEHEFKFLAKIKNPNISQAIKTLKEEDQISILFNEDEKFTNIIVVAYYKNFLFTNICGTLTINEADIRSANIHTTKDNIILVNFNVVDYKTRKPLPKNRYAKIRNDIFLAMDFNLEITQKFKNLRSKWKIWRNRLLRRGERIAINFKEHKFFTIITIQSPDMIGLLYTITVALSELNLKIFYGAIEEQRATILSSFYVLDEFNQKITSENFELIKLTLKEKIKEILER